MTLTIFSVCPKIIATIYMYHKLMHVSSLAYKSSPGLMANPPVNQKNMNFSYKPLPQDISTPLSFHCFEFVLL